MLAEERLARIVEMVGRRGTASVSDLASELGRLPSPPFAATWTSSTRHTGW